tara:strand:- start:56 stop:250 length:195 start_codon:yes stop_codon:yes gene_type:complete
LLIAIIDLLVQIEFVVRFLIFIPANIPAKVYGFCGTLLEEVGQQTKKVCLFPMLKELILEESGF